jgi:hypothetical protein
MRKLLMFVMPLMLSSCLRAQPRPPSPTDACRVPRPVLPDVAWLACDDMVCLSVEDSVKVARLIRQVGQVHEALEACSMVVLTP